jgi:hypothetical protein
MVTETVGQSHMHKKLGSRKTPSARFVKQFKLRLTVINHPVCLFGGCGRVAVAVTVAVFFICPPAREGRGLLCPATHSTSILIV